MRVSRYIAEWLKGKVDHVFGLQGGAVVHLFDACERFGPKPIYCHHEQAAAFAAGAYARRSGYGACIATTGPGSTNCATPLLGCWQDSIPVLFISGQARTQHLSYDTGVRQVGTQEAPIVDIVERVTKYSYVVREVGELSLILKIAYNQSITGRPGPVWVDIPLDIQYSELPSV